MAVKTNTTKTIEKSSTALAKKCENTKANLVALSKRAGIRKPEMVDVPLDLGPTPNDDVLFIGLNGVDFYFRRGTTVSMPREVFKIAVNCGAIPKHYEDLIKPTETAKQTEA